MDSFFETSPARLYFNRLERWFIELRGAPLQLSPDDFRVAESWFEAGIPLELVQGEIRRVVERHREKQTEVKRRLRYYKTVVEKAFDQQRRLQAPADSMPSAPLELGHRLQALAGAVPDTPWTQDTAERIVALEGGEAEAIETQLEAIEHEILERAREGFEEDRREDFERELQRSLERLQDRMPGGDMVSARRRLERQILRRFLGLPEMSLFGLDATADLGDGS